MEMTPEEVKLYMFGDGEWMQEPDLLQFEYEGYECEIRRNTSGCLCGYVKIPKDHPGFEKDVWEGDYWDAIDVHGGLTYAELEDDKWVIGFDCAHSGDILPAHEKYKKEYPRPEILDEIYKDLEEMKKKFPDSLLFNDTYKNIDFVKAECMSIVDQIYVKREKK